MCTLSIYQQLSIGSTDRFKIDLYVMIPINICYYYKTFKVMATDSQKENV